MNLIERTQAILLRPRQTWPVIAAEPADVASIYTGWVLILAAIPAVAGFIGMTLVGVGGFGVTVRVPIVTGLVQMIVGYVLSLVMVFVLALIVDALAPTFGGVRNQVQALKLVAYGMTAAWLGGIFSLLPLLGILGLLAALYSIWLLYTGISPLMHNPPEKSAAYTAVVVVCGILVSVVIFAIMGLLAPARGVTPGVVGGGPGNVTIEGAGGTRVTIDGSSMEAMARRMEQAAAKAGQAQQSGDPQAAGKAAADMLAAMAGNTSAAPVPAADLRALLPESIGELARTGIEASSQQAMGFGGSQAKATYGDGNRRIELSIVDTGGLAGMAALAGWAGMTMDKETDGKVEKVYKSGARTVHEEYAKDGNHAEISTILGNGIIVQAEGSGGVGIEDVKGVLSSIDLGRLEAMKRPAK